MDFDQIRELHSKNNLPTKCSSDCKGTGLELGEDGNPIVFITLENLQRVRHTANIIASVTIVCLVFLLLVGTSKKSLTRLGSNLQRKKPPILFRLSAAGVTLFTMCGIAAIGFNAIFSLMHSAVVFDFGSPSRKVPDVLSLAWLEEQLQFVLFFPQLLGLFSLWAFLWSGTIRDEFSVVAVMLYFLPSFYDSTTLFDEDLQLLAVWTKHIVFGQSLMYAFAFWFPYVCREIRKANKEMENSAVGILNKRRNELEELRIRTAIPPSKTSGKAKRS